MIRARVLPLGVVFAMVFSITPTAQEVTAPPMIFKNALVREQVGSKSMETWAVIRYEPEHMVIARARPYKNKPSPEKRFAYAAITAGEYAFGKSPRVAAALLVSPFFLFSSSKSHWLTVKTADDYALMQLDKKNYRLVIAELEKRARITVATLGENK